MARWICLVMLLIGAAVAEDLTGKLFSFTKETKTDHVRLNFITKDMKTFTTLTVCLRWFTDLKRDYSLLSLATPKIHNEVLIFYNRRKNQLELHIHNKEVDYEILDCAPNKWHSICMTWSSKTGAVQPWVDGQPMPKKFAASTMDPNPIIILGQEQDRYGSHFDPKQSFVGMLTDVHMWDYEIAPCEIQRYAQELNITPGNVINWAALNYRAQGMVFVEKKQVDCNSVCLI